MNSNPFCSLNALSLRVPLVKNWKNNARPRPVGLLPLASWLGGFALAVLLLPGADAAWAKAQVSEHPVASTPTENLIVEGHRLLDHLRGDHENVHDVKGDRSAVIVAQKALFDTAAPMLDRLNGVPLLELKGLSLVWQMLYFKTRTTLEFYLACGSQSMEGQVENAKASIVDGEKTLALLDQIQARNDAADAWILKDRKKEIVRWYEAAAGGILFQATHDLQAKENASAVWARIDPEFRQQNPAGPSSHLIGIVPGPPPEDGLSRMQIIGVGFALIAVLFLMSLVAVSLFLPVPESARPLLVFFFALCGAMATAFLSGSLDLRGELPFWGDKPVMVGATNGIATLILLILIGNRAWKPHTLSTGMMADRSFKPVPETSQASNGTNLSKEVKMRRTLVLLFVSIVSTATIGFVKPQLSRGGELHLEMHRAALGDRAAVSSPALDLRHTGDQALRAGAGDELGNPLPVLRPAREDMRNLGAAAERRRQEIGRVQPVAPPSLILRNMAAEPPHDWP